MPKRKLNIWKYFEETKKVGNSGKWAKCKKCKKEMQGIPKRLNDHYVKCSGTQTEQHEDEILSSLIGESMGHHQARQSESEKKVESASGPSTSQQGKYKYRL